MALKSVKIPFQAAKDGRLATVEGPDAVEQLVVLALSPSDSANPFQKDLGIGYDQIFRADDAVSLARITSRVERIFARLSNQDYAELDSSNPPTFESTDDEGLLLLKVSYINKEADKESEVRIPSP